MFEGGVSLGWESRGGSDPVPGCRADRLLFPRTHSIPGGQEGHSPPPRTTPGRTQLIRWLGYPCRFNPFARPMDNCLLGLGLRTFLCRKGCEETGGGWRTCRPCTAVWGGGARTHPHAAGQEAAGRPFPHGAVRVLATGAAVDAAFRRRLWPEDPTAEDPTPHGTSPP